MAPTYLVPNILAAIAGTAQNILTVFPRLLNDLWLGPSPLFREAKRALHAKGLGS